jgi:hypothetical protein
LPWSQKLTLHHNTASAVLLAVKIFASSTKVSGGDIIVAVFIWGMRC